MSSYGIRWFGWGIFCWMSASLYLDSELHAQASVSSATVGMTRAGVVVRSSQFRVEEFVNYHRHNLPQPAAGEAVAIDASWSRADNGNLIFQVGLATASQRRSELEIRPLNLVLVIDCSGSMSGQRIENVKRGIRSFVERLRPEDLVTVVTYDSTARVALEAACKTDVEKVDRLIRELRAGGSTNLHAGLMLGYEQAEKHFDAQRTNRVILLTDGIANTGVVEPAEIAADSKKFNDRNIDLSTIGLGNDLDQELLRSLSDAGRGLLHFIGDDQDLMKVFVSEIHSLLSSAARDVRLDIKIDVDHEQVRFFGYRPELVKQKHRFELDDLNHDATQVVVGEILDSSGTKPQACHIKLTYVDEATGQSVTKKQEFKFGESNSTRQQIEDLQKNYRIAQLATGLQEFARLVEQEKHQDAYRHLKSVMRKASNENEHTDQDLKRMLDICERYLQECQHWVATER